MSNLAGVITLKHLNLLDIKCSSMSAVQLQHEDDVLVTTSSEAKSIASAQV